MNDHYPQFFTASILKWVPLLQQENFKQIILDSMAFLVEKKRCEINAFVIMPNHIHLIWRIADGHKRANVQRDFLKFTAQQLRFEMMDTKSPLLSSFQVDKNDRKYQIWQRRPLSVELYSQKVFEQKLEYIHLNPIQDKWRLVEDFVDYEYSSASFYELGECRFNFLRHYMDYSGG